MRTRAKALIGIGIAAAIGGVALAGARGNGNAGAEYRFDAVDRGDIVNSIATSGSLSAVVTVDVGTQVSGQIVELNADFNTEVKEGQLIARIDPQSSESRVRQADADLSTAKANVSIQVASLARAEADLASAQANLEYRQATDAEAQRELTRKQELLERGVAAKRDVTQARALADSAAAQARGAVAALRSAEAQIKVAKAQIENAQAQVKQRLASLEHAKIDLERTYIRAPIDGVVISRQVNLGQTVAASLNAPVLFTIAQDLRQMQVEANIDEADIGQIRPEQDVTFTVDAHAGRTFEGKIEQVRQSPQVVQNVVTYTVIVSAGNGRKLLLPGMTANVNVVLDRRDDALRVPNAALRFQPSGAGAPVPAASGGGGGPRGNQQEQFQRLVQPLSLTQTQQDQVQQFSQELRQRLREVGAQGGGDRDGFMKAAREGRENLNEQLVAILTPDQKKTYDKLLGQRRDAAAVGVREGRVWVLDDAGKPKAISVRHGITDGNKFEIVSGDIAAGDRIVVGVVAAAEARGLTGIRF